MENIRIEIEAKGNSKSSHAMNALDLMGIENLMSVCADARVFERQVAEAAAEAIVLGAEEIAKDMESKD